MRRITTDRVRRHGRAHHVGCVRPSEGSRASTACTWHDVRPCITLSRRPLPFHGRRSPLLVVSSALLFVWRCAWRTATTWGQHDVRTARVRMFRASHSFHACLSFAIRPHGERCLSSGWFLVLVSHLFSVVQALVVIFSHARARYQGFLRFVGSQALLVRLPERIASSLLSAQSKTRRHRHLPPRPTQSNHTSLFLFLPTFCSSLAQFPYWIGDFLFVSRTKCEFNDFCLGTQSPFETPPFPFVCHHQTFWHNILYRYPNNE